MPLLACPPGPLHIRHVEDIPALQLLKCIALHYQDRSILLLLSNAVPVDPCQSLYASLPSTCYVTVCGQDEEQDNQTLGVFGLPLFHKSQLLHRWEN